MRSGRFDRLLGGLSARERATMILRQLKETGKVDEEVRRSMPKDQFEEYNHYITLVTKLNDHAKKWLDLIQLVVDPLRYILAYHGALALWGVDTALTWDYIRSYTREPIHADSHAALAKESRTKELSLDQMARELALRRDISIDGRSLSADESDIFAESKKGRRGIGKAKKELLDLVKAGTLSGRRQGRDVFVTAGAFYDWLGEGTPFQPDWGTGFEVFPQTELVGLLIATAARRRLRRFLEAAPRMRFRSASTRELRGPFESELDFDEVAAELEGDFVARFTTCWPEMRCLEAVLEEVQMVLGGEDPALPDVRERLDDLRAYMTRMQAGARDMKSLQLVEPTEEKLNILRTVIGLRQERRPPAKEGPVEADGEGRNTNDD